jgi:HlyD family secretion protein
MMNSSIRNHLLAGTVVTVGLFGGLVAWASVAELSGAVIATGVIAVETNLKKVQHPTGGVVGVLAVKDGAAVKAGDILIHLDETVTMANLQLITKQLDQLDVRKLRLDAERQGAAEIKVPPAIAARAQQDLAYADILAGETRLFESRRRGRMGQQSQLRERISQSREEIIGGEAQIAARIEQTRLIELELKGVEDLYRKNLVPISRLTSLQREAARLLGDRGGLAATVAQLKGKLAEIEIQILQIDQDMTTEVLRDLRETESRIAEFSERKVAAEDQLKRVDIRAPQDGLVHQLAVHTVGGVISAGEVLMLIVPQSDSLTIEARVAPQDIDQVVPGQPAFVRMSAFNQRTTPELTGTVRQVSAELTKEQQTGMTYYTAKVDLSEAEMKKLTGLKLLPGMPVEVHVRTMERTALSYFMKPLTDQFRRSMREE